MGTGGTLRQEPVFHWEGCMQAALVVSDADRYEEVVVVHLAQVFHRHNNGRLVLRILQAEILYQHRV